MTPASDAAGPREFNARHKDYVAPNKTASAPPAAQQAPAWAHATGVLTLGAPCPASDAASIADRLLVCEVIARSLVQKPKLIIFDEPTRGVDVGAIAEIHQLIQRLADEGMGVLLISSYLPEVLNLSDRILVCQRGRIVEEFTAGEATEESIMYAAVH